MGLQPLQKQGRPRKIFLNKGDTFNDLKYDSPSPSRAGKEREGFFTCICGGRIVKELKAVISGNTKSCGCRRTRLGAHNVKNLLGERFGRLKVFKKVGINKDNRVLWRCRCDCGNVIVHNSNMLLVGKSRSCGCLRKEVTRERSTTHGFKSAFATPTMKNFFKKWENLRSRCTNPNRKDYHHYGGRGIKVRWNSFQEFKDDMWESFCQYLKAHSLKETTIDRANTNDDYYKGNCRWANQSIQVSNRRKI